jgi:hypothetical protein
MKGTTSSKKSVFTLKLRAGTGPQRVIAAGSIRSRPSQAYIVPMVARAIVIWERLQQSSGALSIDYLCDVTGYSRTSIYRILRTLAIFGYVVRESPGEYKWTCPQGGKVNSASSQQEIGPPHE